MRSDPHLGIYLDVNDTLAIHPAINRGEYIDIVITNGKNERQFVITFFCDGKKQQQDILAFLGQAAQAPAPHGPLTTLKKKLDDRLENVLCEMKPNYDDSIVGFNEAWDIVRKTFAEALAASENKSATETSTA